jgi:antimicrobial peptide system SdpB family protein
MPALTGLVARHAVRFVPGGRRFAFGRSALALGTASVLAFSSDAELFISAVGGSGVRCDGVRAVSLWCVTGQGAVGLTASRVIALLVLVAVASGFRPRWTCVPHWYVTFGLTAAMAQPNGGDHVAQVATFLLIPVCLADRRRWHWSDPSALSSPGRRGAGYAALLVLRIQLAVVYAQAMATKVLEPEWRGGTAMYSVLHHPEYGLPPAVLDRYGALVEGLWLSRALSWSTVAIELILAVSILGDARMRRFALVVAAVFHGAIGLTMGLFSFALIMLAAVAVASGAGAGPRARRSAGGPDGGAPAALHG